MTTARRSEDRPLSPRGRPESHAAWQSAAFTRRWEQAGPLLIPYLCPGEPWRSPQTCRAVATSLILLFITHWSYGLL